jgi:hypothetical protein
MTNSGDFESAMIQLARDLLARTKEGEINWIETDQADEYMFSATSSSVIVSSSIDRDGDRITRFTLINGKGSEAGMLSSSFDAHPSGEGYTPGDINSLLDEIFFAAKGHVLDFDKTLRDIYDSMGGDGS